MSKEEYKIPGYKYQYRHYEGNPISKPITYYKEEDLHSDYVQSLIKAAEMIWYNDWIKKGSKKDGTCCGGKGFNIYMLPKRKRIPICITIVNSPPTQGNTSAYESSHRAFAFLQELFPELEYYDGWID